MSVCPLIYNVYYFDYTRFFLKKVEDTKSGNQEPKDRKYNGQEKRDKRTNNTMVNRKVTKGHTMTYNTLH